MVRFTLNGRVVEVTPEPPRPLLDVLREEVDLTGTKKGCDNGECGACTVLLNGKALLSCLLDVTKVAGKQVETIEGLEGLQRLHPLQEAFVHTGAVQCGFCTPGMIMEAKALLEAHPHPSREQVVRRLSRHLCRCTGYKKIVAAVLYGAALLGGGPSRLLEETRVGTSPRRIEGREKVTGATRYAADLKREGMLHARILFSPHHRARLLSIDTARALAVPGVAAVVTAQDVPGVNVMMPDVQGWPVLAEGTVEFMGEAVAAVAASSLEAATAALAKIEVAYEPLPAVFDPSTALKEHAPRLRPQGNLDYTRRFAKGDVASGFLQADTIFEHAYSAPFQEHACLETEACLSYMDQDGTLVVKACTQTPHLVQEVLALFLALPRERIRVVPTLMGGAFGGRYVELSWLVTPLLAYKLRRPVKNVFTREESLLYTRKRQPMSLTYKTGMTRDGRLVALQAELVANSGAHPFGSPATADFPKTVLYATGPYDVPHVLSEGKAVGTNVPKGGAMRGLGGFSYCFAIESQMDIMAHELGFDPLEFRLRNILAVGSEAPWGILPADAQGLRRSLEVIRPYWQQALATAQRENQRSPKPSWLKRGAGLGCYWKPQGDFLGRASDAYDTYVELREDGQARVLVGVAEGGQGTWTVCAQIVAQELGVPYDQVTLVGGDTALTKEGSATASKGIYVTGLSVQQAALSLRQMLLEQAALLLEAPRGADLVLQDGHVVIATDPTRRISLTMLARICKGKGIPLEHKGAIDRERHRVGVKDPTIAPQYVAYGTQMAEVEVNTQTGAVRVLKVLSVMDVGKVLHPVNLEGQIEGSVMLGLGFALKEGFAPGKSRSFKTYQIPTVKDMPEMEHIFIEDSGAQGPYGAKGVAECALIPTPAAILNAIAQAIGARVFDLPATPRRVLNAIGASRAASRP